MSEAQQPPRSLVDRLDAWLPQTQCTQCGYPRCRAYAEAMARGAVDIDQCPPGGEITIQALASLLHTLPKPLDARFDSHQPRARAVIEEALCIGCRKCIDACPVDAIMGAHKLMHTVITHECTGCELCLPPCPVDCITMVPLEAAHTAEPWTEYTHAETDRWRARTERRLQRLAQRQRTRRAPTLAEKSSPVVSDREQIRMEIRAAVKRVKSRKARLSGRVS